MDVRASYLGLTENVTVLMESQASLPLSQLPASKESCLLRANQAEHLHQAGQMQEAVLEALDAQDRPIDLTDSAVEVRMSSRDSESYYNHILLSRHTLLVQYYSTRSLNSNRLQVRLSPLGPWFSLAFSVRNSNPTYFYQSTKNSTLLSQLDNSFSVDQSTSLFFTAFDRMVNPVSDLSQHPVNVAILDSQKRTLSTSQYTVSRGKSVLSLKLHIPLVGRYEVLLDGKHSFPLTMTEGKVNKRMSRVMGVQRTLTAGSDLHLSYTLQDKHGNLITRYESQDVQLEPIATVASSKTLITVRPTIARLLVLCLRVFNIPLEAFSVHVTPDSVHLNSEL